MEVITFLIGVALGFILGIRIMLTPNAKREQENESEDRYGLGYNDWKGKESD